MHAMTADFCAYAHDLRPYRIEAAAQ